MVYFLACLIPFFFTCVSRASDEFPIRLTAAAVNEALTQPGEDFDLGRVALKKAGPGVWAIRGSWGREYDSVLSLGRGLHEKFDLTLVYLAILRDVRAPLLSGLVLDRAGLPIANFVVRTTGSHGVGTNVFANTFRVAHEVDQVEPWADLIFREVRKLDSDGRSHQKGILELATLEQRDRFEHYLRAYRTQRAIFAIGQRRPVWILIDAIHWTTRWQGHFAGLIPPDSSITRVYLNHGRELLDLTATCAADFRGD